MVKMLNFKAKQQKHNGKDKYFFKNTLKIKKIYQIISNYGIIKKIKKER